MILPSLLKLIIMLLQIHIANSTWIKSLDPTYQIDEQHWQQSDQQSFEYNQGQQFGAWTKYQPLANIQPLGLVKISQSNCSLIIIAKDNNQQINFLYYICFQYDSSSVIHKVKFIKDNDIDYSMELTINSNVQYEGTWYLFQTSFYPYSNKIYVLLSNTDASQYKLMRISDQKYPFNSESVLIQFGGSLKVNDILFPEVTLLNSFQGIIATIPLQKLYQYQPYTLDDDYAFESVELFPNNDCQEETVQLNQLGLDQVLNINLKEIIQQESSMSGWFKLTLEKDVENQLNFLTLQPVNPYIDYVIINAISINFSYNMGSNLNQLKIQTYSYDFPLLSIDLKNNNLFSQTITIDSEISFKQWHIIQFSNQKNYQEFKLLFLNDEGIVEYSQITSFQQFTGLNMKLVFGSFLQNNLFKGNLQIYSFQFNNCQASLIQFNLCHFSCQKCNGPTQFNCQSCSASSFREFNPQLGTCQCLDGYMENQQDCIDNSQITLQLTEYQIYETTNCQLGYFVFENECIECPQNIESQQINCMECLQNPQTWANDFQCSIYLYQDNQSVYQLIEIIIFIQIVFYLINQLINQLIFIYLLYEFYYSILQLKQFIFL